MQSSQKGTVSGICEESVCSPSSSLVVTPKGSGNSGYEFQADSNYEMRDSMSFGLYAYELHETSDCEFHAGSDHQLLKGSD